MSIEPPAARGARRHRRAQRPATGGPAVPDPGASGRSPDDSDAGWEPEPPPGGSDEERWRREVPPHWG